MLYNCTIFHETRGVLAIASSSLAISKHVPTNTSKLSDSSDIHFSISFCFVMSWMFDLSCIVRL